MGSIGGTLDGELVGPPPYTFGDKAPGTYVLSISDENGCKRDYSIVLTQPTAVTVGSSSSSAPTCDGGSDGSITFTVSVGTGAKTYKLNNNTTTALTHTGLGEGTYTLVATDANGCTGSHSVTLSKSAVSATVTTSRNVTCNGYADGVISVSSPSGGNGAPYEVKIGNGDFVIIEPTVNFSDLAAGTYTITVRDKDGCERTYSKVVSQPRGINR